MAKNKHIRKEHIQAICNIIHSWNDAKLNWVDVCKASAVVLGYVPSRSGLSAHEMICKSFQARKVGIKQSSPVPSPRLPNSREQASAMIAVRDAEIAALKRIRNDFEAKFVRWQYNASIRNVTLDQLDSPLPAIDRKRV